MTLTLNKTTAVQVLTWIVTMLAMYADVIPQRWKPVAGIVGSGASLALHQIAGRKNPDGSPASQPYEPAAVEKSR